MSHPISWSLVGAFGVVLSACGGGDDSGTTTRLGSDASCADESNACFSSPADAHADGRPGLDASNTRPDASELSDSTNESAVEPHDGADTDVLHDGSEGGTKCIQALFGDHYLRSDGRVFIALSGTSTPILQATSDGGAGGPLDGVIRGIQSQNHACALRNDQTVWCWATGPNQFPSGELGDGTMGWPSVNYLATPVLMQTDGGTSRLTGVTALMNDSFNVLGRPTCAIRSDKTVWCWGFVVGAGTTGPKLITSAPTTGPTPFALPIVTEAAGSLGNVDEVSVGLRHICAVASVGASRDTLYCWGNNTYNELGDTLPAVFPAIDRPYPTVITRLPAGTRRHLGAGIDATCVQVNDRVYCWGANDYGQAGTGGPPIIQSGCNHYCENRDPAPPVEEGPADGGSDAGTALTGVASTYVGYDFNCAQRTDQTFWCWGDNKGGIDTATYWLAAPYLRVGAPVTSVDLFSSRGTTGFPNSIRYTTTDGRYFQGLNLVTPLCP